MDRAEEAVQTAGVVGKGPGTGLEQAVRRDQTATHRLADVSVCQGALLDRNGSEQARGRERCVTLRPDDGGSSSVAAQQYVRSKRTAVQLDVHGRRVLSGRPSSTHGGSY